MKQKLAIIQAFMENPDLILLDEPTNGLDDASVTTLKEIIIEQKKRGSTILMASHRKEDMNPLCNIIYRMDSGRLSEETIHE